MPPSGINPLQKICVDLVHEQPEHLATGILDMDTGMTLAAYHEVKYFSDVYVEMLMDASVKMFRGPMISRIDDLISAQHGKPFERHLEEMYFRTPGTRHFLHTVPKTHSVLIFVTAIRMSREKGWRTATAALPRIAPHCPEAIHI